jgi:uncharacterized protein (DUF1697 family)
MKDLRALLEGLGYEEVQTYIQSGNCVFEAGSATSGDVSSKISDAIARQFGFEPQVLVLTARELKAALKANPFAEEDNAPKTVHFYFLSKPATSPDVQALENLKAKTEQFVLAKKVFYLHAPDGIGRSRLAAQAERKIGVAATARNLKTVEKLLVLASA